MKAVGSVLVFGCLTAALSGCTGRLDTRVERAYGWAKHPTARNKNRIEALSHDPDRDMRETALMLMASIDAERAKRLAGQALGDPDGFVRAAAVTILATETDPANLATLASLAADDPVWQVRSRALDGLLAYDDPIVKERFERALVDPVKHVRRTALRAGIAHPGLLTVDGLNGLVVTDPDWENRVDAASALGASKEPEAFTGLEAALSDSNEFVRMSAARQRRALEAAGVARPAN